MNKKLNISQKNRILVLLLGFVVALFTLAAGYVEPTKSLDSSNEEVAQAADDQSPESQTYISAFDAIPNILQISLPAFEDYLIAEIILDTEDESVIFELKELGTTEFFKTLFRRIISPNAP